MEQAAERMQCMEVWGGNQPVDSGVSMAGLDAWVYSRPYGNAEAGGDVYYVSSCATGRVTRLLLADVSGHGQPVADIAKGLRGLMRRYVNYLDQALFVREMNQQFIDASHGGIFATAIMTTFFAPTNDLTLCNAGHPPPFLYRADTRQWSLFEQKASPKNPISAEMANGLANIPLGIVDITSYDQFGMRLKLGDLVLCYTDSLIEAKDEFGNQLNPEGLLEIVKSLDVSDPTEFIPALLAAIKSKHPANLTEDDVTALLFRPNSLAHRVPAKDRFMSPFRILGGLVASLRPGRGRAPWPEFSLPNFGGAMIPSLAKLWTRRNEKTFRNSENTNKKIEQSKK